MSRFDSIRLRIGHRGAVLMCLGILDIIYGCSIITVGGATGLAKQISLWLPYPWWGFVWVGVGIFLIIGAFHRHDRWHFGVATAIKFVWAGFWILAWHFDGYQRGWVSSLIWISFAVLVMVVSSWPEARRSRYWIKAIDENSGDTPVVKPND